MHARCVFWNVVLITLHDVDKVLVVHLELDIGHLLLHNTIHGEFHSHGLIRKWIIITLDSSRVFAYDLAFFVTDDFTLPQNPSSTRQAFVLIFINPFFEFFQVLLLLALLLFLLSLSFFYFGLLMTFCWLWLSRSVHRLSLLSSLLF